MKVFDKLCRRLCPDRRPEREKVREREFILAVNKLKTLSVTDRGGMSIDPEELREQVVASREQLKHLVHKPGAPSRSFKALGELQVEQGAKSTAEASVDALDCIEVVAWRRLPSGGAVRYVCLQSTSTGRYAVATASLFSGSTESLPPWVDANTNRQVASALRGSELQWFGSMIEAMDAWDNNL